MSQLEKLRTDICSLSHDQLLEKVREIRADRKITKSGIPKSVEKKSKSKKSLMTLFDSLSPEDRDAMIRQLRMEEGDGR